MKEKEYIIIGASREEISTFMNILKKSRGLKYRIVSKKKVGLIKDCWRAFHLYVTGKFNDRDMKDFFLSCLIGGTIYRMVVSE